MDFVTEHGEITYEDGLYQVWDETADLILETPDKETAFEVYHKYSIFLEREALASSPDVRTTYPQGRW